MFSLFNMFVQYLPEGPCSQPTYLLTDILCIKKRLFPFIEEHHSDGQYLFLPDLASSHYSKTVKTTLKLEGSYLFSQVNFNKNMFK